MMLVDSHCHLDDERLYPEVDAVLKRADAAGIKVLQTICTERKDFPIISALADMYPNLYCSFGIHPHHADKDIVDEDEILEAAQHKKVIGIGETGLDYFYENAPKEAQIESFKKHIRAARKLDLPVIIHSCDADDDTIAVMDEMREEGPYKALFHCFSSSTKLAEYGMKNDVFFSASGIITFKKSDEIREIFKKIPEDLLLVETDSPYLAPEPLRGKTCEPAYTAHTAQRLADIREVTIEQLAAATTNNFFALFNKAKRPEEFDAA